MPTDRAQDTEARDEPLVCMVFTEQGNAIDAFDYTPEELERQAGLLRGVVTMEPSPFGRLA